MATVGAYIRFDPEREAPLRDELVRIEGIELFELDEPATLGLIIEADSLDAAHATLTQRLRAVEGVMGAFPVYVNIEDEQEATGREPNECDPNKRNPNETDHALPENPSPLEGRGRVRGETRGK